MTIVKFIKAYPISAIVGLSLFFLILFFPLLLVPALLVGWWYEQRLNKTPTKPYKLDHPANVTANYNTYTSPRPIRGNRLMSSTERNTYLLSPQWKALRKLVIARDKCCQLTGDVTDIEVHHINYDNLGNEYLDDLVLLSRRAHQFVHDYYGSYDRCNTYPITEELRAAYALSLLNNP